mgnify:CR=1 FL=1
MCCGFLVTPGVRPYIEVTQKKIISEEEDMSEQKKPTKQTVTFVLQNDKGEKLSKSKMNFTDPWKNIDEYGVDALPSYLMSSAVLSG